MAEPPRARSLASREEADRFIGGFVATLDSLGMLLAEQSDQIRAGRLREGLAREDRKTELAGHYLKGLELARANAVAIARFLPDRVSDLRRRHEAFRIIVEANQAVIATARAVSEGLVRGVADEMARQARPQGYGATSAYAPARPIAVSTRL